MVALAIPGYAGRMDEKLSEDHQSTNKPRRRWFQISLRTSLVLMGVACLSFAWLGLRLKKARDEERAFLSILKILDIVEYDVPTSGPARARAEMRFAAPEDLDASETLRDDDPIIDPELRGSLRNATRIRVRDGKLTNTEIMHLGVFARLESLSINSREFSDSEVVHLQGLTNLVHLDLSSTQVTDAGLVQLKSMKQLRTLNVTGTRATEQGCQELHTSLPLVEISR